MGIPYKNRIENALHEVQAAITALPFEQANFDQANELLRIRYTLQQIQGGATTAAALVADETQLAYGPGKGGK